MFVVSKVIVFKTIVHLLIEWRSLTIGSPQTSKCILQTNTSFVRLKDDVSVEQPNQTDQNVRDTNDQSEDGGHLAARLEDSEEEEDEGYDSQEHTLNGERLRHTLR